MDLATRLRRARFRSRVLRAPTVRRRYAGLRPDDALLASYPRSGTTWLRFLLSEVLSGTPSSFDPDGTVVPYVGDHAGAPAILPGDGRLIMTHETLPAGPRRVLYVVRDPRAVAVSEFRWLIRRGLIEEDLDRFISDFVRGRSNPWGSWGHHVERWGRSEATRAGTLRLVRYETLRADPVGVLGHAVRFLGRDATPDTLAEAVERNSLESMQRKEQQAPDEAFAKGVRREFRFVRSGETSGWRSVLSTAHAQAIRDAFDPAMRSLGYDADGDAPPSEPRAESA